MLLHSEARRSHAGARFGKEGAETGQARGVRGPDRAEQGLGLCPIGLNLRPNDSDSKVALGYHMELQHGCSQGRPCSRGDEDAV